MFCLFAARQGVELHVVGESCELLWKIWKFQCAQRTKNKAKSRNILGRKSFLQARSINEPCKAGFFLLSVALMSVFATR